MRTAINNTIPAATGSLKWRLTRFCAIAALVVSLPTQAMAFDSAVLRSMLIPGTGQAHEGNFRKAAIFAGATIAFASGLLVSQVHYNQAVDRFRDAKRTYEYYPQQIANGQIVSQDEIDMTYSMMETAYNDADSREVWRDFFLAGLLVTYSLNIIDVILSPPHDPDLARTIDVEATPERIMLTKTIRF